VELKDLMAVPSWPKVVAPHHAAIDKFGFKMCIVKPSLFIYQKEDSSMILNTSTNNFLGAYQSKTVYDRLCARFRELFEITVKEGTQISYPNLQIIQSKYGVSNNQTKHIHQKIVNKYFPPDKVSESPMKDVHTPFCTDSEYEKDLMEQLSAGKEELKQLEAEYGGTYPEIMGDIIHVESWSRPDLSYSLRCLRAYTHGPNQAAFTCLNRALQFLATHIHHPIFYPRRNLQGFKELCVDFDSLNFKSIELPLGLCTLADTDHAQENATRQSCECSISLLNGVFIQQKMQQQRTTALSSTDSKTMSAKTATKQSLHIQDICTILQLDNNLIRPVPIFLDSNLALTPSNPTLSLPVSSILEYKFVGYTNKLSPDVSSYRK
jgi:hypothetical protein